MNRGATVTHAEYGWRDSGDRLRLHAERSCQLTSGGSLGLIINVGRLTDDLGRHNAQHKTLEQCLIGTMNALERVFNEQVNKQGMFDAPLSKILLVELRIDAKTRVSLRMTTRLSEDKAYRLALNILAVLYRLPQLLTDLDIPHVPTGTEVADALYDYLRRLYEADGW